MFLVAGRGMCKPRKFRLDDNLSISGQTQLQASVTMLMAVPVIGTVHFQ